MSDDQVRNQQITQLIAARKQLEQAVAAVRREAAAVQKLDICGTEELPVALSALESADYLDSEQDACPGRKLGYRF